MPRIRRLRVPEAFVAVLLALNLAAPVLAVELGEIRVHSWIGKQIKASIPLAGDDASGSEARCFKGVLVNLHGEPVSALKLTMQHMTTGSVLLLFGGSAVDEPAATVVVENVCGTGGSREYAVLLDLVPASQAAATPVQSDTSARVVATDTVAARKRRDAEESDAERIWIPDTIYPIPGMPPMRMASMLGSLDEAQLRPAAFSPSALEGAGSSALLRLDRAFDKFGLSRHGDGEERKPWIAALAALLLLGATGWVIMRIRAMRAAAKPWLPIDDRIDAGGVRMTPTERLPS